MDSDNKAFAQRVCEYSIGSRNKRIKGTFHAGNYQFKPFEFTGEYARALIAQLIKIEETN